MANIFVNTASGWTVVTTSTVTLGPGDILTSEVGSLVIDYSPELSKISDSLEKILAAGTSTGFRVHNPYDWTQAIAAYDWYVQQIHKVDSDLLNTSSYTDMVNSVKTIMTNTDFPSFY